MFEIEVEDSEVKGLLNRISGRIQNMSPVMRAVSSILHDAVMENFEQEGRPKWPDLAESTKQQKAKRRKERMLRVTGQLMAANVPGHNSNSAWVSNNKKHAIYHQRGTDPYIIRPKNKPYLRFSIGDKWITKKEIKHPGMPARPFMKLTAGDLEKIKGKLGAYIVEGKA